jgi:ABC-type polysaccharide/polyol phosphate export permease
LSAAAFQIGTTTGAPQRRRWAGDYILLLQNLILKDIRIRYRNMSLGVFWSLLNPLVMMGLLWFVFTRIFPNNTIQHFALFAMCGLVPYNVFATSWLCGTLSVVDSSGLIKRVPVPREIVPVASVLANCVNMSAQVALLLALTLLSGCGVNPNWMWLIYLWACEIVFVMGLALVFSALNVYIRDIRYMVESANLVMFWLVPVFYPFSAIRPEYREFYQFNPIAAIVLATRSILIDGAAPPSSILVKLTIGSALSLGFGLLLFRRLQKRFYNYL